MSQENTAPNDNNPNGNDNNQRKTQQTGNKTSEDQSSLYSQRSGIRSFSGTRTPQNSNAGIDKEQLSAGRIPEDVKSQISSKINDHSKESVQSSESIQNQRLSNESKQFNKTSSNDNNQRKTQQTGNKTSEYQSSLYSQRSGIRSGSGTRTTPQNSNAGIDRDQLSAGRIPEDVKSQISSKINDNNKESVQSSGSIQNQRLSNESKQFNKTSSNDNNQRKTQQTGNRTSEDQSSLYSQRSGIRSGSGTRTTPQNSNAGIDRDQLSAGRIPEDVKSQISSKINDNNKESVQSSGSIQNQRLSNESKQFNKTSSGGASQEDAQKIRTDKVMDNISIQGSIDSRISSVSKQVSIRDPREDVSINKKPIEKVEENLSINSNLVASQSRVPQPGIIKSPADSDDRLSQSSKLRGSKISWGSTENRKISVSEQDLEEEDQLYDFFLLNIAKDILKYGLYSEEAVIRLTESYIQANRAHLDEARMREKVEMLKAQLDFPLPKRQQECECEEEPDKPDNCKCCPTYDNPPGTSLAGTCNCGSPVCPAPVTIAEEQEEEDAEGPEEDEDAEGPEEDEEAEGPEEDEEADELEDVEGEMWEDEESFDGLEPFTGEEEMLEEEGEYLEKNTNRL